MNKVKFASILGTAVAAVSLITAPSASAATSAATEVECTTWSSGRTGYAKCTGMLPWIERFRVKVTCIDSRGAQAVVPGNARSNGQTSSASCPDSPNVGIYKLGVERWRL